MASRKPSRRPSSWARWLLPRAAAPLAAAALLAALPGGGGSPAAATPRSAPSYAALASREPTGLSFVDPHAPRAGAPSGPTWPISPPEGTGESWPVKDSIRPLKLSLPGIQAWIARSAAGGACVMLDYGERYEGMSVVALGCSTPEGVGTGASLEVSEIPGMPGRVVEAGVVPDGVTAVRTPLADGSTTTQTVSDNAWARSGTEPPAPGSEPAASAGG